MLMRMMMTTVAALALAAPVTAQDQGQPKAQQQLEQAQQELQQQGGQTGAADQPATAAQEQPAEAEGEATTAEGETAAPDPAVTAEEAPVEEAEVAEEEAAPPADMTFIEVQDQAQFLADEEVIGKDVVNVADEEVGTIADLVMDQDQKLVGVVLSVGGFLGIGEKWVAIPVEEIEFPTPDQPARLLTSVTEEQLKNAPDFTTRATVEAEEAAEQAQIQQQQQMQQVPPPATTQQ